MDDDFNTAGAMGAVFGFVTECNQYLEQAGDAADRAAALAAADTLAELLDTLGVELPEPKVELPLGLLGVATGLVAYTGDDVDEAAAKILEARSEARAAKNCDLAVQTVARVLKYASLLFHGNLGHLENPYRPPELIFMGGRLFCFV